MLNFRYPYGSIHLLDDHPYATGQRVMDPPKKNKLFERDFIVLSEFSEQVGPIPVVRVPAAGLNPHRACTLGQ